MSERLRLATRTTFRSLQTRNFRLFAAGQVVSQAGTWMQMVAIVWVVLDLTDSGTALGLVTAAQFLPMLVLGAWTGLLADRLDRHKLLIATQVSFMVLAVGFSVLTLADMATVPVMYLLSLAFGIITAVDNPARRVFVSELVDPDNLANAVGLNSALMTASRVVGPALAGAVVAGPGAALCFVLNSVTYLAVLVALLRMDRSAFRTTPPVARAKGQLREGFAYVRRTPELRVTLVFVGVIGVAAFNYQVTLPLLAERTFGGDATTFTVLYTTMSLGSLAGALAVARKSDADLGFLVRVGTLLGVSTMALAFAPTLPLALLACLPVGYATIFLFSASSAAVQLTAEPVMRGRVLALLAMLFLGSKPIGGPVVGWIAEMTNPRLGIAVGGVATALVTLWTARQLRARGAARPAEDVAADAAGESQVAAA